MQTGLAAIASENASSGLEPLRLGNVTRAGLAVIFLFFGAFGGWAALAPLDSAVIAPGVIKVAGERKLVQHLEGGMVAELSVANGDRVEAGAVLLRLDETQARSQLDVFNNRMLARQALAARLRAERDDRAEIGFPLELLAKDGPAAARDAVKVQRDIFEARQRGLADETAMLNERFRQTEDEIRGLQDLVAIEDQQITAISEEASELERLTKKGLTTRERHLSLRRQQREVEGERATNIAAAARAKSALAEIEQKKVNLRTVRLNEAVGELSKVESELFDLEQQQRAAEDILNRTLVTAPVDGVVMDLQVHTTGGVVRSGETLMTVVPRDRKLVVEAIVLPEDVETVTVGQSAHVRVSALSRYDLPPLEGTVETISADRLLEERTGAPYFTATIVIADEELIKLDGRRLMPGMTSEVMIRTGTRTMLAYIAEPLMQNFRRAVRE